MCQNCYGVAARRLAGSSATRLCPTPGGRFARLALPAVRATRGETVRVSRLVETEAVEKVMVNDGQPLDPIPI